MTADPAAADPLERVRVSFAGQPMMATLGATLVHVAAGSVHISLPFDASNTQQHGYVHGGAIVSIADSAAGYAAMTLVPADTEVLTIELKTNFLRPASGLLRAEGRVIRAGRQTVVAVADVYAEPDGVRRHVAMLSTTLAALTRPR